MKLAIMQPYFFPYLGYFQLLACSDVFVIYDDVQYIKNGWINRNRLLINQEPHWLTFPVQKGSLQLVINQRHYVEDLAVRDKIMQKIEAAYRKAPHFIEIFPVIREIMAFESDNVSYFNTNLIRCLASFMEIKCQIIFSSKLKKKLH